MKSDQVPDGVAAHRLLHLRDEQTRIPVLLGLGMGKLDDQLEMNSRAAVKGGSFWPLETATYDRFARQVKQQASALTPRWGFVV